MLANNPLNLALRFVLELAALTAVGFAAWQLSTGVWRWVMAILPPVAMATVWGTFGVPDDESRGATAPIAVSGAIRLVLELFFFGMGVTALFLIDEPTWAIIFGGMVLVHYAVSWDRIVWLLRRGGAS